MRFWGNCGLQTASEVRSDLRFEIYGPNYILCYHVCLDCFGPFWTKWRKERRKKEERTKFASTRVVVFAATKTVLELPISDPLSPSLSIPRHWRERSPIMEGGASKTSGRGRGGAVKSVFEGGAKSAVSRDFCTMASLVKYGTVIIRLSPLGSVFFTSHYSNSVGIQLGSLW